MTLVQPRPLVEPTPAVDRRVVRLGAGVLVLAFLVHRLGAGPFLDGLRGVDPALVVVALVVTAGTTWCCAQRWALVSARLGEALPLRTAYAACYRSLLVNATLPGGVLGDVHRGARHGWRAVVGERGIGQVVQLGLVGVLVLPAPARWWGLAALALVVAAARPVRAVAGLSVLSTAGHLLLFVLAARATGTDLPLATLLPVGALVLVGASIPLNAAGWGPREGVAAWAFTAYGSTAAAGLAAAVTFGVLGTLATLPGLLALGRGRS